MLTYFLYLGTAQAVQASALQGRLSQLLRPCYSSSPASRALGLVLLLVSRGAVRGVGGMETAIQRRGGGTTNKGPKNTETQSLCAKTDAHPQLLTVQWIQQEILCAKILKYY